MLFAVVTKFLPPPKSRSPDGFESCRYTELIRQINRKLILPVRRTVAPVVTPSRFTNYTALVRPLISPWLTIRAVSNSINFPSYPDEDGS